MTEEIMLLMKFFIFFSCRTFAHTYYSVFSLKVQCCKIQGVMIICRTLLSLVYNRFKMRIENRVLNQPFISSTDKLFQKLANVVSPSCQEEKGETRGLQSATTHASQSYTLDI